MWRHRAPGKVFMTTTSPITAAATTTTANVVGVVRRSSFMHCPCAFGLHPCSENLHAYVRNTAAGWDGCICGVQDFWACLSRLSGTKVTRLLAALSSVCYPGGSVTESSLPPRRLVAVICNRRTVTHILTVYGYLHPLRTNRLPNSAPTPNTQTHVDQAGTFLASSCGKQRTTTGTPPLPPYLALDPLFVLGGCCVICFADKRRDRAKVARAMDPECELPNPHPSIKARITLHCGLTEL